MTIEEAIAELIVEVKIITNTLQEIHDYMTIIDKRIIALEIKMDRKENNNADI